IRVHRMFSRDIPHEVLNYRLDLGAVSFVPRDPQLQATEILKDELTLVVHPKHALARRKEVDVADLGGESFVAHSVESPFRRRVTRFCAKKTPSHNSPIKAPTLKTKRFFAKGGGGGPVGRGLGVGGKSPGGGKKKKNPPNPPPPPPVYRFPRRGARLPHAAAEL